MLSLSALPTIAVMRSALPSVKRFALVAAQSTSPLSITSVCRSQQWLQRITAIAMHHQAVAWSSSTITAMCSCQSLCLVATTHHRSLLFLSFVGSASGHGMLPCPSTTKLSPGVPDICGHRTLRQHASLLHNAPLHQVHVQSVAKLLWWSCTAIAPCRVYAAGVMQSCLRWGGRQLSVLPGRFAPYAPTTVTLLVCLHGGFIQALCAVLISQRLRRVMGVGPRPPLALACFASIACAVCPSAPQGGSLRTALQKQHHILSLLWQTLRYVKRHEKTTARPPRGEYRLPE